MSQRPQRLSTFAYRGIHRYSLTFCTWERRYVFTDAAVVNDAIAQIMRAASDWAFAVLAYCFMPDHLHLLVEGTEERSDLLAFAHAVKQRTGYKYRRALNRTNLWQKGYYEHVVRDDESTIEIARYIFANPVRAGLVSEPRDYPFSGSFVWERRQINELWQAGQA